MVVFGVVVVAEVVVVVVVVLVVVVLEVMDSIVWTVVSRLVINDELVVEGDCVVKVVDVVFGLVDEDILVAKLVGFFM